MVAATKFQGFVQDIGRAIHNLNADTIKVALTNTTPVNTNTVLANITQISGTNGYTTGGATVTGTGYSQTSGTASLTFGADPVFTASGGNMGPFQYVVLYNDTPTSPLVDPLIMFWNYGSAVTLADTETFTVDFTTNIMTLA